MDPDEFTDAVHDENRTALSRLGSSKALYADTAGEMDDDVVLGAAADRAHAARETFLAWVDDEPDDRARELFESVAAREDDHYETIVAERGDHEPGELPTVAASLRGVEGTVRRVGALAGWALTVRTNTDQVVGYFVGQADPTTSGTFREMSDGREAALAEAVETLGEVCESDDDWTAAVAAAGETVQADYDAYVETLESLGINPKPVC